MPARRRGQRRDDTSRAVLAALRARYISAELAVLWHSTVACVACGQCFPKESILCDNEQVCWRHGRIIALGEERNPERDGIGTEERTSNNVNSSVQRSLTIQAIPAVEAEPTRGLCTYPGGLRR